MVIWQLMAINPHSKSQASTVRHLNLVFEPRTTANIHQKVPSLSFAFPPQYFVNGR